MCSSYEWVHCHNFSIPPNAVKAGKDLDGSDLYVGKTNYRGDEIPTKIIPAHRVAYLAYAGKEVSVHDFSILVEKTLRWVRASGGSVPHGAVPGGKTSTGETLYIGRSSHRHATVMGKVHPSHGCLYVSFDGKETPHRDYEVLVA